MPTFEYEAYTREGKRMQGVAVASSRAHLAAQLKSQGLVPTVARISRSEARSSASIGLRSLATLQSTPTLQQYALLTQQLGALAAAGIPISQALELAMERSSRMSAIGRFVQSVHAAVVSGESVANAFERAGAKAPPILIALIRTGEARGTLAEALLEAATYLERRSALQQRLQAALIYPSLLVFLALCACVIITVFLVPSLVPLFRDNNVEPPFALATADQLATFISNNGYVIGIVTVAAVVCVALLARTATVARLSSVLALRTPLLGYVLQQNSFALFSRTLGTLLRGNVPILTSLPAAIDVVRNRILSEALMRAASDVNDGRTLSAALERSGHVPSMLLKFVKVGEQSGRLGDMLVHFAGLADSDVEQRTERFLSLLTPILTILMGLFVGGLILSVLNAILSVNELAFQ